MYFRSNQVYHIYNQGNNRQLIFFTKANYKYFIRKIEKHVLPYADLLAYCLMPNHFHLLIHARPSACLPSNGHRPIKRNEMSLLSAIGQMDQKDAFKELTFLDTPGRQQMLSFQIGQMLSSYSKAINIQEKRTGSLFKKRTNAKDGSAKLKRHVIDYTQEELNLHFAEYRRTCVQYIHQNPVKAGLVSHSSEWKYSSASQYLSRSEEGLCDIKLADKLDLINCSRAYKPMPVSN